MNKNKTIKIILIALLVVLLGFVIIKINKTKYFIEEPYKHENYISDRLKVPLYDTILYYSLKEQGISKEVIQVQELRKEELEESIKGLVATYKGRLVIFLRKDLIRSEALEVIPYEVIHVKQLKQTTNGTIHRILSTNKIYLITTALFRAVIIQSKTKH